MVGERWFQEGTQTHFAYIYDENGRKSKRTLARGPDSELAAAAAYQELVRRHGSREQKQPTTVRAAVDDYLADQAGRVSANRHQAASRVLRVFAEPLGTLPLVSLTRDHVQDWVGTQQNYSPGTQRTNIGIVQAFLRWAVSKEYLARSPADGLRRPQGDARGLDAAMTQDTLATLLEASPGWLRDVLEALWLTGARPGRLCEVRAEHFDPLTHSWKFSRQDNEGRKKVRFIVLCERAKSIHDRLAALHPTGTLFRGPKGLPLRPWEISEEVRKIRRRLGLPEGVIPYGCRHGFAVRTLQSGFSRGEVASLLGHTSTRYIDEVYGHALETVPMLKGKLDRLNQSPEQILPAV